MSGSYDIHSADTLLEATLHTPPLLGSEFQFMETAESASDAVF
jgi:hypothetical protein